MPEKKKVYTKFEGIIVPSSSGEGLAETDKAWLVELSIPEKYSGEEVWIPKVLVKNNIKVSEDVIRGEVENWVLKKLDKKEVESAQTEVEVIQPAAEEEEHIETKQDFNSFIGKKGMEFKEVSISLGEKVSVDYQSKNAQVGAVISLNGYSIELAYQSALNFVRDRLKEEVKRIKEEML